MPRLPEVLDRNALPEEKRGLFDYLTKTRGSVRMPFSIVMNSPEACERISHLGTYLRFETALPKAVSELAVITTARHFDCRWEWAQHVLLAREAGVSEQAIDVIGKRGDATALSTDESLPVAFTRQLLEQHRVDDETFAQAQRRFGDGGAIDLTATVGYYSMMASLLNALEIIPPADRPQLP